MTETHHTQWLARMTIHHNQMVNIWCGFLFLTWMLTVGGLVLAMLASPVTLWIAAAGVAMNIALNPAKRARWNLQESERYACQRSMRRDALWF